jgi:hypothetical protein
MPGSGILTAGSAFPRSGATEGIEMRLPPNIHYIVEVDGDPSAREFETLDEACDTVIMQFPVGVAFTIRRVTHDGSSELVLRAIRSTTRLRYLAS